MARRVQYEIFTHCNVKVIGRRLFRCKTIWLSAPSRRSYYNTFPPIHYFRYIMNNCTSSVRKCTVIMSYDETVIS